jgi:excinuclease ABC subunit C
MKSEILDTLPLKPGVYLMKDASGKILYIGKAKALKERVKQYFNFTDTRAMIPFLLNQLHEIEHIVTFSEKEALILENTLIKKHKPKYNILLKDDKTFISLVINPKEKWPRIKLIRYKEDQKKEEGLYFGPYTSALSARATFETMTKIFPLRQCSDRELLSRKRPCLLYSIKRCLAPCVAKCTKLDYDHTVKEAVYFLKGKSQSVLNDLKKNMEKAANALEFEKAGSILKTIRQIEETLSKQKSSVKLNIHDLDAINFIRKGHYTLFIKLIFRNGSLVSSEHYDFSLTFENDDEMLSSFLMQHYVKEKAPEEILLPIEIEDHKTLSEIIEAKITTPERGDKKNIIDLAYENAKSIYEQEKMSGASKEELLLELKETLGLSRLPLKIECYDTSHISGSDAVASMAAFTNGIKDKKRSRIYKIKKQKNADDYSSLRETLTRRLTRALEEDELPDLIIVDGGKGQLSTVLDVCKNLNIASLDVISLAKEESRHDKGLTKERIFIPDKLEPISLNPHSSLHFFLQTIRDEAHRKAIQFHRKKRQERVKLSVLDNIQGIGPLKKKRLLQEFGSVKRILEATDDELSKVKSINKNDIEALKAFKNPS